MKKHSHIIKTLILVPFVFSLLTIGLMAAERGGSLNMPGPLYKNMIMDTGHFDGNRIYDDLENNGMIVSHRISGHSGMEWPKDSHLYINFASGIWVAGKVGGDIRTAVGEYGPEFVSGPWGGDASAQEHQLYIVNKRDFADPGLNDDFQNWPADLGAPWVDVDGDGVYTPLPAGEDHPEFISDQVIWWVMNDSDLGQHSIFNTLPLGIEIQMTIWGYDRPDAFGDMMFVKALIINKGGENIDDTIIGLWADPDLGNAGDDFVGCDTTLGLGYCYNDGADADYGADVPAIGYDFFQGPIVESVGDTAFAFGRYIPDYKNLKMSSFTKYINGDPVYADPNDATEAYNYMSGFLRDGSPFINSATGEPTKFVHPDDPNDNSDAYDDVWVDSDDHASGDRRFLMNAGPFTLADGDSQEVVFGILIARGSDHLASITALKEVDQLAQLAYDIHFKVATEPVAPMVEATALSEEIVLSWDDAAESYSALDEIDLLPIPYSFDTTWVTDIIFYVTYDTTIAGPDTTITADTTFSFIQVIDHIDTTFGGQPTEYRFEGYNIYQLESPDGTGEKMRVATFDLINGVTEIEDDIFDPNYGEMVNVVVQFGSDSGIQRFIHIDSDKFNNDSPLMNNTEYYFAVTAYGYNPYGIPKTLESDFQLLTVMPLGGVSGIDYSAVSADSAQHTSGNSDGSVTIEIIDPLQVTGHAYEVFTDIGHYYRDVDGLWKPTADPDSVGNRDCSGSTITAAALAGGEDGTVELIFTFDMVCGDNWVDGIILDFPDDMVVSSWDPIPGCSYGDYYGQNCNNTAGTLDAGTNSIFWGDSSRSTFGQVESGGIWSVYVLPPASYPFDVAYHVYDDGYDGDIVDAHGFATVAELGYDFISIQQWNVKDLTTAEAVIVDQTMVGGVFYENVVNGVLVAETAAFGEDANPIFDGVQIQVGSPPNEFKDFYATHNAGGAIEGYAGAAADYYGYPGMGRDNIGAQQTNGSTWFITTSSMSYKAYEDFLGYVTRYTAGYSNPNGGIQHLIPDDFEFRFTETGGKMWDDENGVFIDVPMEVWNIGVASDPADDFQLLPLYWDDDGNGVWDLAPGDHDISGGTNDPYMESFYILEHYLQEPGTSGYEAIIAALTADPFSNGAQTGYIWASSPDYLGVPGQITSVVLLNMTFANWNGGDVEDPTFPANVDAVIPETGTVFRIVTTKPNSVEDVFTFTTSGPTAFTVEKGDVNLDSLVNISDAIMLINYLLQINSLTGEQEYAADYNSDLFINIADVVGIINAILNQSARTMASLSDAENATVSVPEMTTLHENTFGLPLNITADGSIAALQLELSYDHKVLAPQALRLDEELWDGINVLYNSPEEGKVIYLFYSMSGVMIPLDKTPVIEFENISGNSEPSSSIELLNAVLADINGTSVLIEYGNRVAKTSAIPETYALYPNYPNPFNPITNIEYNLPEMSLVTVQIYNIVGQQVCTLVNRAQMSGHYRIQWNGRNDYGKLLASGVYLIRFKANDFTRQQKIMLLK